MTARRSRPGAGGRRRRVAGPAGRVERAEHEQHADRDDERDQEALAAPQGEPELVAASASAIASQLAGRAGGAAPTGSGVARGQRPAPGRRVRRDVRADELEIALLEARRAQAELGEQQPALRAPGRERGDERAGRAAAARPSSS